MALRLLYGAGNVTVFADGISTTIKINLDDLPPIVNTLPPSGIPISIVNVMINSANPVPPFTSALQGKVLVLTFSTPLVASGPDTSGVYGVNFNLLYRGE